jgi:ketosteroid isomerase-like protein
MTAVTGDATGRLATEALRALDEEGPQAFAERLAPNAEFVHPAATVRGREDIAAFLAGALGAFDEARHEIGTVDAAGAVVVIEGNWRGRHARPMVTPGGEVPPSGRTISVPFAAIARVRDGSLTSVHIYSDQMSFAAQLGLLPEPAGSA